MGTVRTRKSASETRSRNPAPRDPVRPAGPPSASPAPRRSHVVDGFESNAKLSGKQFRAAMDRQLEKMWKENDGRGGVVLRISQGDHVAYQNAVGATDRSGKRKMTVETPFDIASITKTFTAVLTLKRVEERRLRLDSTLGQLLPRSLIKGFNEDITVEQLLSHTSGLPHYWTDGPHGKNGRNAFLKMFLKDPDRKWAPTELLDHARKLDRVGAPGQEFHYSDTNYVLLGLIHERLAGKPFERQVQAELLEPLGMKDTRFSHDPEHALRPSAKQAHRFEGKEDLFGVERQGADWAGGGLVSTVEDLETFFRALSRGELFKSPKTMEKFLRRGHRTEKDGLRYGLGIFQIDLGKKSGSLWGHDGHGNSFAYYWPEQDVFFTGTLNQTESAWWPLVEKAVTTSRG